MKIEFLPAARDEFLSAVSYYDSSEEGLGDHFFDEVWSTISRIAKHPRAWQQISVKTRRCLTKRFPYGVIYEARSDSILIIAVMHLNRDPENWRKRVTEEPLR
jgi:plasmid stabilization system protein ParE